jgi:hypothetical protein
LEGFLVYQEWRKGPTVWDLLKSFPELFFTQSMFMFCILKVEMTSKKKWNTSLKPIISIFEHINKLNRKIMTSPKNSN